MNILSYIKGLFSDTEQNRVEKFTRLSEADRQKMFIEFCKSKPADKEYDFFNVMDCPLAEFGKSIIKPKKRLIIGGSRYFCYGAEEFVVLNEDHYIQLTKSSGPSTYGALVERMNKL
jgi:hypothetical protein